MKTKKFLIPFLILFFSLQAYSQEWEWAEQFTGPNNVIARSVATDDNGNTYILGYFKDRFDIGDTLRSAGDYDIFLACYDADRNLSWSDQLEGPGEDVPVSLICSDNHLFLAGYSNMGISYDQTVTPAGIFVAKFTCGGQLVWIQQGGDNIDQCTDMAIDADGNIFLSGIMNGYHSIFGKDSLNKNGFSDILFLKLSANGSFLHAINLKGKEYEYGRSIATDGKNLYVAGRFSNELIFGDSTYGDTIRPADGADVFLASYDTSFNFQWANGMGGTNNEDINDILVDDDHNIWITGWFAGTFIVQDYPVTSKGASDIFVEEFSGDGTYIYAMHFGNTGSDEGKCLALTGDNTIMLAGTFEKSINFGPGTLVSEGYGDVFLAGIKKEGVVLSVSQAGGTGNIHVEDLTIRDGHTIITGSFLDNVRFGDQEYPEANNYDGYIASLNMTTGIHTGRSGENTFSIYPNPADDHITLTFGPDTSVPDRIMITDITGKTVVILPTHGNHTLRWDCRDDRGQRIAPGIYLLYPQGSSSHDVKKVLISR